MLRGSYTTVSASVPFVPFGIFDIFCLTDAHARNGGTGDITSSVRTVPDVRKRLTVGTTGHMGLTPKVAPFLAYKPSYTTVRIVCIVS